MNAREIYLAAVAITDLQQRAAFLDRECAGRDEVRAEVERLFTQSIGDVPTVQPPTGDYAEPGRTAPHTPEVAYREDARNGTVIDGKYVLVEPIGEGGMGSVWKAEQTHPVKRLVAVKLIKAGMDSKQVLLRFEAERQALALMDHINIAKVYDGGVHDQRPYFVMELVHGVPITTYCDNARLTPQQRLELFVPVCQAIQHAHQKGIIHRDIKPSNVLVALYDGQPVVKVIDFGVAKATGGALTEQTLETGVGVVGTPEYMSPEQATFNNADIDTRSDVYSLGILLYELLTGSPPFSRRELVQKGLLEILRVVREDDPPRPSTKLSGSKTLPSLSANRNIEPKKLTGLLRNELDWIVMKALEKDRARRYDSANGFAADVLRYLAGEPVQAHPPSTAYRLRKYVRRHRGQVLAASLILMALVVGLATTTWQWLRAERNATQVRKQLDQIVKNHQILTSVFDDLNIRKVSMDIVPLEAVLAKRLVTAGKQLDGEAVGDPVATAALQDKLGVTLLNLGHPAAAKPLFEKASEARTAHLGAGNRDTLITLDNLAYCYRELDDLNRAMALWEQVAPQLKTVAGADDPATLQCSNNLATVYLDLGKQDQALSLFKDVYERRKTKFGENNVDTLDSQLNLASALLAGGQAEQALMMFEETLRLKSRYLGADHPDTLYCMANLANCYQAVGQPVKALERLKETYEKRKARLGAAHRDTLTSLFQLAEGFRSSEAWADAIPLHEDALRMRREILGADHNDTLMSQYSLGLTYYAAGQNEKSLQRFVDAVSGMKRWETQQGKPHPSSLAAKSYCGLLYHIRNQPREALPLLIEAYPQSKAVPELAWVGDVLINVHIKAGQNAEATLLIQQRLIEARKLHGAESLELAEALTQSGQKYLVMKQFSTAEQLLRESLLIREKKESGSWKRFQTQSLLGSALMGQKKHTDAEPLLTASFDGLLRTEKEIPADERECILETLDRLIELYTEIRKPAELEKFKLLRKERTIPRKP